MDCIGSLEIRWIQGFTDKSFFAFVNNETVCYTAGSHICFLNVETKIQHVFESSVRGIGALTANGKSGIFAFSDHKLSPSIFVYNFKDFHLKNELKGSAQLDYTSLALSDDGPYLACCSSLPDHIITVWNWEKGERLCAEPEAGRDVISLVFNPLNCFQLCALGTTSLTLWNIEKSTNLHVLKPRAIELPTTDGSFVEGLGSISGIKGGMTQICTKARLTPGAICWTQTSELYVGCTQGFLLLVNPESLSVSVLFNPTSADAIPNFQCLTLGKNGLIAKGKENVVHCLQIKGSQISITQTWQTEGPVSDVMHFPDSETLLLRSDRGQIYMVNPAQSDKLVKILDVCCGTVVAAAWSHTEKDIFVTVQNSGELQLSSTNGLFLGSLRLQAEVTSLACCPVAQYAAVGTASGNILFVDLSREQEPHLVHQAHLYGCPVDHLVFDQEGHFLLTGASDSHIYVLDAKPSKMFSVIGYTVLSGPILSLSTQCIREFKQVKVLGLCARQNGINDGTLLTLLSLPVRDLAGPDCVGRNGCLSPDILQACRYEVPYPLQSCVLGVSEIFAYCHKKKSVQQFQLPQGTDGVSDQHVVQLTPEQEVRAHPLGPVRLVLSPHHLWLASVGRDGLLRVRETASMERYIEVRCHSYRDGGVQSVSFSPDSQTLITAGRTDGSIVCADLRKKGLRAAKVNKATQYSQSMDRVLGNILKRENRMLANLPDCGQASPASLENSEVRDGAKAADVTEQDKSYNNLLSAAHATPTWLERRREAVIKEDNEQFSDIKESMRKTIRELQDTIQEMRRENETLPEIERLKEEEFCLNIEEQSRQEAIVEQEVTRVRNEIEREILKKCYLHDVLKRECWDSMKVKGKVIKSFHSEYALKNYPLKERTEKEMEDLHRVQNIRALEMAQDSLKKSKSSESSAKEEEQREEGNEEETPLIMGSFSAQLGCLNPYLYDQFSVRTTEQRINQIILLQDVIYHIKKKFNADFEALHRQKVQEVSRVRERNRQIGEIMLTLDVSEELWEPSLTSSEQPETLLTVDDSEIKVEKYFTPEEKREEERKKLEEQRHLAAKKDNYRDRAIDDMKLKESEDKKDNILKMEIPPPEFVLTKPGTEWDNEEKKIYEEYEKKCKELREKKEEYKESLATEMKKLQATTKAATEKFDESFKRLFEKKLKCEMSIYQEELKIANLMYLVQVEEEMTNQELELKLRLEKLGTEKDESSEEVKRHEEKVESFQETYDKLVAEDKGIEKDFKKEVHDLPNPVVSELYKLFRRRPRVHRIKAHTDNSSGSPDPIRQIMKAMEELDAPESKPPEMNPSIWKRFCVFRRRKVETEHKVRASSLILAETQAFLQRRREEYMAIEEEIRYILDELLRIHKEKTCFQTDIIIQFLLKQGQVEVSLTDLTSSYTDSVLLPRRVVEDLNTTIRALGEQKITSMVKCKDLRKHVIQLQWEHKKMEMQIEDLNNKARDIRKLKLNEEQKDYLSKTDQDDCISKRVSLLKKTIDFQGKAHQHALQSRVKKIKQLQRKAAKKAEQNAKIEQRLPDMHVTVAELRTIYEATASEQNQAVKREERYQQILRRDKLKDLAMAQAKDLAFLKAEVERLRMRSFPSFDQLHHK